MNKKTNYLLWFMDFEYAVRIPNDNFREDEIIRDMMFSKWILIDKDNSNNLDVGEVLIFARPK